jgi:hypothetical protein
MCAPSDDLSTVPRRYRELARAIIAGDASMPKTLPCGPTWRLATIASVPVPQPIVEHGLSRGEAGQTGQMLAERAIATVSEKPDEEVVARGPMQDAASCGGCCIR